MTDPAELKVAPQAAAGFVTSGLGLQLGGGAAFGLAASAYSSAMSSYTAEASGPAFFMFVAAAAVLVGLVLFLIGVHRLVQHADRAAGAVSAPQPRARSMSSEGA
ncbi:hypothetical protein [Cellulomonas oligotrophica]|nr:hypothetical protein [Cellulomonas oligotrophica]NYD87764.1 hypothetical protein [Cellulomonas oligotrophica]